MFSGVSVTSDYTDHHYSCTLGVPWQYTKLAIRASFIHSIHSLNVYLLGTSVHERQCRSQRWKVEGDKLCFQMVGQESGEPMGGHIQPLPFYLSCDSGVSSDGRRGGRNLSYLSGSCSCGFQRQADESQTELNLRSVYYNRK